MSTLSGLTPLLTLLLSFLDMDEENTLPEYSPVPKPPSKKPKQRPPTYPPCIEPLRQKRNHPSPHSFMCLEDAEENIEPTYSPVAESSKNSISSKSIMKQQVKNMMADVQTQWEARKRLQDSK